MSVIRPIGGLLILGICGGVAQAEPSAVRVAESFDRWRAAHGDPAAALVVLHEGVEALRVERGMAADTAAELQSNSKTITALCLQALVDEGVLSWDTALSQVLDLESTMTLGELVTHTSGLWPDQTQGAMAAWRGAVAGQWDLVTQRALARDMGGTRGRFAYNNENYAILGSVIEAVTNEGYANACARRVLAPLDVEGQLSALVGSFGPWGGWQMSPHDFGRLHYAAFGDSDPSVTPLADVGNGIGYGLGSLTRPDGETHNFWHFGLLCFGDGQGNGGSYAVTWGTGWTVVAAYRACVDDSAMVALDRAMVDAVYLAQ